MAKKRFVPRAIDLAFLFPKPCPGPELVVLALVMVDLELATLQYEIAIIRVMLFLVKCQVLPFDN
jgi:hypothetical protein